MGKRLPVLVCALMVGALVAAGCSTQKHVTSSVGTAAATVLRTPMLAVMRQQAEMVRQLEAGNVNGARASYLALADAFGQVLGPVRMTEPGLAGEMEHANTALQELLHQQKPDRAAVGKQAQLLTSALRQAADGIGVSLVGTAAGQVGSAGVAAGPGTAGANTAGTPPTGKSAAAPGSGALAKAQSVEVRAREYRFMPPKITVKKGTRVTIKLINEGTDKHEFELDAFHFEIKPIAPRTNAQASFVADRTGSFEFACHVDNHYEKGMKGILVVE